MISQIDFHIDALDAMKVYPKELFFLGKSELLQKRKISIVGSRKANKYAKELTHQLARKIAHAGGVVVSGGAIGIDAIAHRAAGGASTIMVAATGLDKRYPAINKNLIAEIEERGLVLSQFQAGIPSRKYNFVLRNELVVALGEVLVVAYADKNSGTMRSVEYAKKMGKKIYVLPHRIGESVATNELLANKEAEAIYDIDTFLKDLGFIAKESDREEASFILYCKNNPKYEDVLAKFSKRLFEAELLGEVEVVDGRVRVLT